MKVESEFLSNCEMISSRELCSEHLHRLFIAKDVLAIEIPNFVSDAESEQLAGKIIQNGRLSAYLAEPGFLKPFDAWFEQTDDKMRSRYLANANQMMHAKATLYAPLTCPMERLHSEIARCWPAGATVQHINGKPMFYGLPRLLKSKGQVHPHVDLITWDSPGAVGLEGYRSQAAANIYLQMPEYGGDLALWWKSVSQEEYAMLRDPANDYGLDMAKIGHPDLLVRPRRGSAILFDSTRVHSVLKASDPRITSSAFIGFYGPRRPLTQWS